MPKITQGSPLGLKVSKTPPELHQNVSLLQKHQRTKREPFRQFSQENHSDGKSFWSQKHFTQSKYQQAGNGPSRRSRFKKVKFFTYAKVHFC